ncbi:hypothetical protein [Aurantiacibacter hainanensis]|uniref:hypothetical protein n=1 Tax=Aurantiacibacter hainanensis TaxID=3076114 RepID=UPI0030C67A20
MSADAEHLDHEGVEHLRPAQKVWCVLMLSVILGSVATLGVFAEQQLYPEGEPVLRLDLDTLTPKPGFEL